MKIIFLRLLVTVVAALSLVCAACSSEPGNIHDMLLYIMDNYEKNPEKTMGVYSRFGAEGEEALIRTYFNFEADKQPFYSSKLRSFHSVSVRPFLEKLSGNREFLRRICAFSDTYPQNRYNNEFAWVLEHDKELFLSWYLSLASDDKRSSLMRKLFQEKYPEEAYLAALKALRENIEAYKKGSYHLPFSLNSGHIDKSSAKRFFTAEDYHLIFANNLERAVFGSGPIQPDLADWLKLCPEDFSIAVWRENNRRIDPGELFFHKRLNGFLKDSMISGISYSKNTAKPSKQGNKTMLFYDGTKARKYSSFSYEYAVNNKGIPLGMMSWLPQETTPDDIRYFDKAVIITLFAKETGKLGSGGSAIQWIIKIDHINVHTDTILSTEEFYGSIVNSGVWEIGRHDKHLCGTVPMKQAAAYILQLVNK